MTFTDLKKTEFWGAPRHWIGFWVKKKKKERKEKRKKQSTTSSNTSTECHQHQERPVQIGRYPFRNHTPFSSVLLLVVYSLTQRTFFFTPEAHPACMGAGDIRCGSPSQQAYRHVGLHERVPPDSRKARRSIIQPQHPANLNAAAPSFQSKMLSGSARLWHSACSLALRRSQSRKRSQQHRARRSRKTIHEAQADVTGLTKRPETNITTTKKLRSHENINESLASVRVGNSSTSTRIELAEQRRTQRARARYHPCQELTRARKDIDGEMATSDGKPRAQAIPRRCFSRACIMRSAAPGAGPAETRSAGSSALIDRSTTRWAQTSPKSGDDSWKSIDFKRAASWSMWPGRARAAKRAEFRVLELHQTCRWQCFSCWCFSASTPRVNDRTPSIKRVWNKLSSGTTHASVERCRTLWEDRRNRFPACVWTSMWEAFSERFFSTFRAFSKKRRRVDCNRVSWLPPGEAWR